MASPRHPLTPAARAALSRARRAAEEVESLRDKLAACTAARNKAMFDALDAGATVLRTSEAAGVSRAFLQQLLRRTARADTREGKRTRD